MKFQKCFFAGVEHSAQIVQPPKTKVINHCTKTATTGFSKMRICFAYLLQAPQVYLTNDSVVKSCSLEGSHRTRRLIDPTDLPAAVIGAAAGSLAPVILPPASHSGRSSVILGSAGACHRLRQLPLPEWSCRYSILDFGCSRPRGQMKYECNHHGTYLRGLELGS